MALIQNINVSVANDGLGDTLRDSQVKANANFVELDDKKVEKVSGQGLTNNNFTDTLKTKLDGIEAGAEVNVQSDWNQTDNTQDDYILNKPDLGSTFTAVGGFDYNDLATTTTPIAYTSGDFQLTNDTLGAFTFISQPPYGVTQLWDSATNTIDLSALSIGDEVFFRVDLKHTTTSANQITNMYILFGEGTANEFKKPIIHEIQNKTVGAHEIDFTYNFYIGNTDWRDTPAKLLYNSDASSSIVVNGWHPYIIRKSVNILEVEPLAQRRYLDAASLVIETEVPNNSTVYVESLNRSYNWLSGSVLDADNIFVIDQTSQTANGRWISENTPLFTDFEVLMDELTNEDDASSVDKAVAGLTKINRENSVKVNNFDDLPNNNIIIANEKGEGFVNVYLQNKNETLLPAFNVKGVITTHFRESVTNYEVDADWAGVGVTDKASFLTKINADATGTHEVYNFSLIGDVLKCHLITTSSQIQLNSITINSYIKLGAYNDNTNVVLSMLTNNYVGTAIPDVSTILDLGFIVVDNSNINIISGLSGNTTINYIKIDNSQLTAISGLSGLVNINSLSFDGNSISLLEGIDGLTLLTSLNLSNNNFTDYSLSETYANSLPVYASPCTMTFTGNPTSITGTNLETILISKNVTIIA